MRSAASCANSISSSSCGKVLSLQRDALGQPALGDRQQLREEPADSASNVSSASSLLVVLRKYFSSVSLASRKATSLSRRRFRSSSVWMLASPTIGRVLGPGRDVGGRERQPASRR